MEIDNVLMDFAKKHGVKLVVDGEVGFGRPCVGFTYGTNYVDYNPIDSITYDYIDDMYSDEHDEIAPSDSYHKHDCVAVLVHGDDKEKALKQLVEWVAGLEKNGCELKEYSTGATGIQAMISGVIGHAFVLKAN